MWRSRLNKILSASFEMLSLSPHSGAAFRGRYLRLPNGLAALGRLISQGAEAVVYEVIDLHDAALLGVAKICRYPPTSAEYRAWAVPYRMQWNPASTRPDIELRPAHLHEVPSGLIKLQQYVSEDPETDWGTVYPALPILALQKEQGLNAALQLTEQLIERFGPRGIFLEQRGLILSETERWEEARDVLEAAFHAYETESLGGVMRSGIALARAHKEIYRKDPNAGAAAVMTLKVPNGPAVSQVIYSDLHAAALSDTLEDRSLYALFEVLSHEPCFVSALFNLADELAQSQMTWGQSIEVLDRIEQIEPGREDVKEFRAELTRSFEQYFEHLASIAAPALTSETAGGDGREQPHPPEAEPPATLPRSINDSTQLFDDAYRPEPTSGQLAVARYHSVAANLASNRLAEAENAARAAIQLDPSVVRYPLALVHVLDTAGRHEEAAAVLDETICQFADSPEPYLEFGERCLAAKDLEGALAAFLRAAHLDLSSGWQAHLGLGQTYRRLHQRSKALVHLKEAYINAPSDSSDPLLGSRRLPWKAFAAQQLVYELRDDRHGASPSEAAEALQIISEAIDCFPDTADLFVSRAQSLLTFHRNDEAIADLERAVQLEPAHEIATQFLQAIREHMENDSEEENEDG